MDWFEMIERRFNEIGSWLVEYKMGFLIVYCD